MLSKAQIKHISALRTKKYRTEHSQFIVEGKKSFAELLKSDYHLFKVYYTTAYTEMVGSVAPEDKMLVSDMELGKISLQKNPEGILALAQIPQDIIFAWEEKKYIALDSVRDPGNLGTIIRLADWFGAEVICSADCVELYNPKVIQATMGSLFHVPVHYLQLSQVLANTSMDIIASTLNGETIYKQEAVSTGVLIIGNEANGISSEVLQLATMQTTIPNQGKAESLNAAMACGILSSHYSNNTNALSFCSLY